MSDVQLIGILERRHKGEAMKRGVSFAGEFAQEFIHLGGDAPEVFFLLRFRALTKALSVNFNARLNGLAHVPTLRFLPQERQCV